MSDRGENNVIAVLLPLGLAIFGFWIWMFVDALRNKRLTPHDRKWWAIVLVVLRPVGALLYYFKQYRGRRLSNVSRPKTS